MTNPKTTPKTKTLPELPKGAVGEVQSEYGARFYVEAIIDNGREFLRLGDQTVLSGTYWTRVR